MFLQFKNVNFYVIFFSDLVLFALALLCAYMSRFDFFMDHTVLIQYYTLLPWFLVVKSLCFFFMNLYRGMYRYAGLTDMVELIKAVVLSSLVLLAVLMFTNRFQGYSRTVFLLDGILTLGLTAGFRMAVRVMFREVLTRQQSGSEYLDGENSAERVPVLIYGAGNAGEKLLREIMENPRLRYQVKGFGDDAPDKKGRTIHGIQVLGMTRDLPDLKAKHGIKEVFIAMPSATGRQMRAVVDACKTCGLAFKTVPGMGELVDGKVNVKTLRDVSYRDLLRRKPVELDREGIAGYLNEKVVMVTGAGGSIGSELCRQILKFNPRQLVLLDACEAALYRIQMELKHRAQYQRYATVLAQIQNAGLMDKVMQRYRPDVIFHAAAYKHVPMVERNPWEAVSNNILGNQVMVETAVSWGVGHFVLVSTDKAVRPTNVMGASKRICELIVHAYVGMNAEGFKKILFPTIGKGTADDDATAEKHNVGCGEEDVVLPPEAGPGYPSGSSKPGQEGGGSTPGSKDHVTGTPGTKFMAVRFGNVVGSSGSVIPLFREQIERGGPITVTHPDVTRYFMTIPEAAQLILQAGAQGEGGETFILEMGESIKIVDMARDLIRLCGLVPDEDIEIRFTGLRQGEKLYEELITEGEGIVPTSHKKIMVLKDKDGWNGYGSREKYQEWLMDRLNELYAAADQQDICAIRETMQELVPEFKVQDSKCVL